MDFKLPQKYSQSSILCCLLLPNISILTETLHMSVLTHDALAPRVPAMQSID